MAKASDPYSRRRRDQKASTDADQAEFAAILRGTALADAGVADDHISGVLDDEAEADPADRELWHKQDLSYDDAVGKIAEEVERRSRLMGDTYPFRWRENHLVHEASKAGFYEFCLATSCAETITEGDFVQLPRVFERVVTVLIRVYMGENSDALHTGAPRDKTVGSGFMSAMAILHERSGEWQWGPEPDLPEEHNTAGDLGVDFVVWKKSPDGRPGQLFILGQCACGDDWPTKYHDVDLNRFFKWFRPRPHPDPVRAFATPHHLSDGHFAEATQGAGLVFDRARLTLLAEQFSESPDISAWRPCLSELRDLVVRGPT